MYLRKENCLYQACPSQDCNKKVVDQQNGMFRCEKCDKEFPNFKYRLILSVSDSALGSLKLLFFSWATHAHTSIYANAHNLDVCSSCIALSRCFCWDCKCYSSSPFYCPVFLFSRPTVLFHLLSCETQVTLSANGPPPVVQPCPNMLFGVIFRDI